MIEESRRYFVGIDPSMVGTGIIMLDADAKIVVEELVKTTPKEDTEQRLLSILSKVAFVKGVPSLEMTYLEGLAYHSKSSRLFELAGLHFLLRCYFYEHKIPFTVIPPTSLKKFITGKGNCGKELMLLKIYKRWGIEFDNNNLADAYALARMNFEVFKNGSKKKQVRSDGAQS